jgi:hypothetical protein
VTAAKDKTERSKTMWRDFITVSSLVFDFENERAKQHNMDASACPLKNACFV